MENRRPIIIAGFVLSLCVNGAVAFAECRMARISAGNYYSCGVLTDGSAACWGGNDRGKGLPPRGAFVSIASGYDHSCGLGTEGLVRCWGSNYEPRTRIFAGQAQAPPGKFVAVSAGGAHSCGIHEDGTAKCWGSNTDGSGNSTDQS